MTKLGFLWAKGPENTFILDVCTSMTQDSNRKYKHEDDQ